MSAAGGPLRRRWRVAAAAAAVGVAGWTAAVLLAWSADAWATTALAGTRVPTAPVTAACLGLLAVALLALLRPAGPWRVAAGVLLLLAVVAPLAVLVATPVGRDPGLQYWLLAEQVRSLGDPAAGTMTPWTAAGLVLLAVAIALAAVAGRAVAVGSVGVLVAVAVLVETVLLSYAYGSADLLWESGTDPMSLGTALAMGTLLVAVVCARPDRLPLGPILHRAGWSILGWVIPAALLLPVVDRVLTAVGEAIGLSPAAADLLAAVQIGVAVGAVVLWLVVERGRAQAALALEQDLALERERFHVVFQAAPVGMVLAEPGGRLIAVNAAFARFVRRSPGEVLAAGSDRLCHPEDQVRDRDLARQLASGELDSYRLDKRYLRPDGTLVWADVQVSAVRDDQGRLRYTVASVADVDVRRRAEQDLSEQVRRDPLTGLANRTELDHRLDALVGHEREHPTAVVFADVDGFKAVNDRLGHGTGDEVLRAVARRFGHAFRSGDLVARVGGDEFVGIARLRASADIVPLLARVRSAVSGDVLVEGRLIAVRVSVGGSLVDERGPWEALQRADEDMYAAKASSAGGVAHQVAAGGERAG